MPDLRDYMSQTLTPQEAAERWLCPVARTFAMKEANARCRGPECAAWRFLPLMASDPAFKGAVAREIEAIAAETGASKDMAHKAAVARVAADPSAYCIPAHHERGYCGLGGAVS